MSSILRLTFLYVWSNCSLVLANIRRHAAHWDCTQHDKVCNWISGFLFIIQYFQNNASSSTVLCHIIFILTITVTFSWESNFYRVCIIKLFLLRLSLLRFTSDSPTDQRNPFSGDYCVHACVCVSRFTSEVLRGEKGLHLTTLWQVSSETSHTLLHWHKDWRPAASLATALSCLVLCPGKCTSHVGEREASSQCHKQRLWGKQNYNLLTANVEK